MPKGNKIGKLKIPLQVLKSRVLLRSYIRGLFDTDGSFYIRRKKDPVIEITSIDNNFLKEIQNALILLGFNARISKNKTFIYNKKDINLFFNKIHPANKKHLKRYQNYLDLSASS